MNNPDKDIIINIELYIKNYDSKYNLFNSCKVKSIKMGKSKKEIKKAYCQFLIQEEFSILKKQEKKK